MPRRLHAGHPLEHRASPAVRRAQALLGPARREIPPQVEMDAAAAAAASISASIVEKAAEDSQGGVYPPMVTRFARTTSEKRVEGVARLRAAVKLR